jgi:hypothetical protein
MTEQELHDAYLEWIKDYCNNEFLNEDGEDVLPGGVTLTIEKLMSRHGQDSNIASEQVGDLSQSFFSDDIPKDIKSLLRPYRRIKFA